MEGKSVIPVEGGARQSSRYVYLEPELMSFESRDQPSI